MFKILIADSDPSQRDYLRQLLEKEEMRKEILLTGDGAEALKLVGSQPVDLLITRMRLPGLDGLSLARKAIKADRGLQVLFVLGHSEFSSLREDRIPAEIHTIMRPVSPVVFHETLVKILDEMASRESEALENRRERDSVLRHELNVYLDQGEAALLAGNGRKTELSSFDSWHCVIYISCDAPIFDRDENLLLEELNRELHRDFFYLNLNARQALLLFEERYCDYALVAKNAYLIIKRRFAERFYLAVSPLFEGGRELSRIMLSLEYQMQEKFFHPEKRIYTSEQERAVSEETQDSTMIEQIGEDVIRRDTQGLRRHFGVLSQKYRQSAHFSAMYVKFVFSSVLSELYQDREFANGRRLDIEIDRLYSSIEIGQILTITRENVEAYIDFVGEGLEKAAEDVSAIRAYIGEHVESAVSARSLARIFDLTPEYIGFAFLGQMGMNISRYHRSVRMARAMELVKNTGKDAREIGRDCGYASSSYFLQAFRDYFGLTPEKVREGAAR